MSNFLYSHHHYVVGAALLATSSVAAYSTYKLMTQSRSQTDQENVYETEKLVNEYLVFHFGAPEEILRYKFGPKEAIDFPRRVAEECLNAMKAVDKASIPSRALDIGCAVGRTSFELAREFDQVVGIDYSQAFIDTCNLLREKRILDYSVTDEGDLQTSLTATIDPTIDRSRTHFQRGDACSLPLDLGQFGCVVGANLLCRLPNPSQFLDRLPSLVAPGGILVLTTPCSWMAQFTPKENWTGGFTNKDGEKVTTFDTLKEVLGPDFDLLEEKPLPMLIRETQRKYQWTAPQATIWKRKGGAS